MREKITVQRRRFLQWGMAGLAGMGLAGVVPDAETADQHPDAASSPDWSLRVVRSNLKRHPDAARFGGRWGYQPGLFLFGQYLVYRRTRDQQLLDYMVSYVDGHVDEQGKLDRPIAELDSIQAANLLILLYQETNRARYRIAADIFRIRYDSYPRTTDGGFWHGTEPDRRWQLWLDGTYMAVPFLVRYGTAFEDSDYANDEAVRQLLVYHKHLKSTNHGLLFHAYDESGKAPWADPVTHHSGYFWCRALGWYGMTVVDTLDVLPPNHAGRNQLIGILRELIEGLAYYQDSQSGLWYQIVDKPKLSGNWTETSSSCMFTYIIDIAVKRGYVSQDHKAVAEKGRKGVLTRLSLGPDGLTNLSGICPGTNVGSLQFYLNRKRQTNDLHGMGAFLLMNEEWNTSVSSMKLGSQGGES